MLNAAIELFHRHGVNGTSIDQILEASDTGKSQFAHYFKSKDGLIRAAVKQLHEVIKNGEAATGYELKTWKDLDAWFQSYIDFQKSVQCQNSCPLGTIGNDLTDEQEVIRQDLQLFFEWSRGKLERFFAERQAAAELSRSLDAEKLADFCITIIQGGMLLSKVRRNTLMFENAASQALQFIRAFKSEG